MTSREGFGMGVSQKTCRSLKAVFPRGLGEWFENISNFLNKNGKALLALCAKFLNGYGMD